MDEQNGQTAQEICRWRQQVTRGLIALFVTAFALFHLGAILGEHVHPRSDLADILSAYIVDVAEVRPEPAERLTYLAALVLGPFLLFGLHELLSRLAPALTDMSCLLGRLIFYGLGICLAALLVLSCAADDFFYLRNSILFDQPLLAVALALCLGLVLLKADGDLTWLRVTTNSARLSLYVLAGFLLIFGALVRLISAGDPYVHDNHFEGMFHANVQVHQGSTMLVDLSHQYGLYPHFLEPVFRVVGLDVLRYSMAMALLATAVNGALLYFMTRSTSRTELALLGFASCIFFVDFYVSHLHLSYDPMGYYDPYFQGKPVRMLFPAVLFLLTLVAPERLTAGKQFVVFLVFSLGVFWNLDSGLPTLLTWLLLVLYDDSFAADAWERARRMLTHALMAVGALATVWLSVAALLFAHAGRFPDWRLLTAFQELFYVSGFMMLPMPVFHSWNVLAALYCGGLLYVWIHWRRGDHSMRARCVLMLTLLGLGQFAYYQGRSHDWVLPFVCVPAFALVTLLLDELLEQFARWGRRPRFLVLPITLTLIVLAAFALRGIGSLAPFLQSTKTRLAGAQPADSSAADLAFLRAHTRPGDTIALISNFPSVYYLQSQTRPVISQSLLELFRVSELRRLEQIIIESPELKVFADKSVLQTRTPYTNWPRNEALVNFLDAHFTVEAQSPSGNLLLYRRRP